jgi:hypothetical protein
MCLERQVIFVSPFFIYIFFFSNSSTTFYAGTFLYFYLPSIWLLTDIQHVLGWGWGRRAAPDITNIITNMAALSWQHQTRMNVGAGSRHVASREFGKFFFFHSFFLIRKLLFFTVITRRHCYDCTTTVYCPLGLSTFLLLYIYISF